MRVRRLLSRSRRSEGETDLDLDSSIRVVLYRHFPPMGLHDLPHRGQSETNAETFCAEEGFENSFEVLLEDSRTVIEDSDQS